MTIERARQCFVRKPWGSIDLRPWSDRARDGATIGEIWFERQPSTVPSPRLLLKLLFASQPLSIQVHPGDAMARWMGLPHGKNEAWYVLSASAGAKVAVGLKRAITASGLRAAIDDGSIADLVSWRPVERHDAIPVPAGTIHAIGAGLVIAEIQERCDVTFRLFDYDRQRGLDVDEAIAAARTDRAQEKAIPVPLSDARMLLVASAPFVLERIDLRPDTLWHLDAPEETWLLVLSGSARIGALAASVGTGLFIDADRADIAVGPDGLTALVAYRGPDPQTGLLLAYSEHGTTDRAPSRESLSSHDAGTPS